MVDDVVAVGRPGARRQQRRRVQVTDTELVEIGNEAERVVEGEILVELQPGSGRDGFHLILASEIAASRAPTCGALSRSFAGAGRRRRQFGCCSLTVPGRLGCSSRPSTSSIGIMARSL